MSLPSFNQSDFESLKTIKNVKPLETLFGAKIRNELIPWLNQSKLAEIPKVRELWITPRSHAAFSDSIKFFADFDSDNPVQSAGWYVFNNGGRSELQFNVGMDRRWLRVGFAFHLGAERFGDPIAVKGLFNEFKDAVRISRVDFEQFVIANRIEIDWYSDTWDSGGQIPPKQLLNFLLTTPVPTSWIFVGRLLRFEKTRDAAILSNSSKLAGVMTTVLEGLWPYYLKAQRWGHGFTLGKHRVLKRSKPVAGSVSSLNPQGSSGKSPSGGKTS